MEPYHTELTMSSSNISTDTSKYHKLKNKWKMILSIAVLMQISTSISSVIFGSKIISAFFGPFVWASYSMLIFMLFYFKQNGIGIIVNVVILI